MGATLLHICAEYNLLKEAEILIAYGADINARIGRKKSGHSPIFHAVTSNYNLSFPVLRLLLKNGADTSLKATINVPNSSKTLAHITPLEYALNYPHPIYDGHNQMKRPQDPHQRVIALLDSHD